VKFISVLFFSLLVSPTLVAQEESPHPELQWKTLETEHFLVHFHNGAERTAQEIARAAEHAYGPITELYQHKPDRRVSIVIRDYDDYSNGAAYFYDNKIDIWAPALDFELRGTHPWIENVVTHEFTHIVQIQTAMKLGRKVPGIYLQWLGYEAERRPDVLYGFPNVIVSYPLSAFVVPAWFAEGVAQFNHPDFQYDRWDSHRDMILRSAMLDDKVLTWEEMAVFGKTSLGNEESYNAGYSFVSYIAQTYGLEQLRAISNQLAKLQRVTIGGAIEAALGKSGEIVYEDWKKSKLGQYRPVKLRVDSTRVEGALVEEEGFGNFYPAFSPDGKKLAYVSTKDKDYFSLSAVVLYDLETKKKTIIQSGIRSTLSFSPDGHFLYYSKSTVSNPYWSKLFDLYRYDLREEKEVRLTKSARAQNPRLSSDGTKLVFVVDHDGTGNVAVADSNGGHIRRVTAFRNGEQVFTPVWSPDGRTIAFGYSSGHGQSLVMIDGDGTNFRLVKGGGDCRNPAFSPDGKALYYSSDSGGIFNLYELTFESHQEKQVTNLLGGAFLPAVNVDGSIAYASYTSTGYKIALLNPGQRKELQTLIYVKMGNTKILPDTTSAMNSAIPGVHLEPKEYRNTFTSLSLVPLLRFDNYNPKNSGLDILKGGLYFASTDVVGKLSLFGSAALNRKFERDLFFVLEYRDKVPGLFQLGLDPVASLEFYNITRRTASNLDLTPFIVPTDVTYNLLEFDVFLKQKVLTENSELKVGYTFSRYNADIGSFFNPNDNALYPSFRSVYLLSGVLSAQLKLDGIQPSGESEINPVGGTISLRYSYELNKFNQNGDFEVRNGFLEPVYTDFDFHRLEASMTEHIALPIPRHTLSVSVRGGSILGKQVDDFFNFYAGGFSGMRGYPFYALGGNQYKTVNLDYRFPIWRSINLRLFQFYFTKLYGSVFGDVGAAWKGDAPPLKEWKTDAGFELRLESFSFYVYPTRIFFSGAYGFDRFDQTINSVNVAYGREWRFYFGVLFGFELSQVGRYFR
jgi:Tol biopolymer transport system component